MKVLQVGYKASNGAEQFARSLRETGFAVLRDHPISANLVNGVFDEWASFFNSDKKFEYTFKHDVQAGYFPFKTENAKGAPKKDLKEFFHYYPWNGLPKSMSSKTQTLFEELEKLASTLLQWVEDETPQKIRDNFSMPLKNMIEKSPMTLLRILHYPPVIEKEEGAIRAAAHEDINLITLLPAATAPGLQVKDRLGNWHEVPCDPGQIVINCGDMLQLVTENHFISTTHRVMNPQGEEALKPRYSMPLFLHPREEVLLSGDKTARRYLDERLLEIGLKKKK